MKLLQYFYIYLVKHLIIPPLTNLWGWGVVLMTHPVCPSVHISCKGSKWMKQYYILHSCSFDQRMCMKGDNLAQNKYKGDHTREINVCGGC